MGWVGVGGGGCHKIDKVDKEEHAYLSGQNKNIHINFFIFSLQQVQLAHIFRLDNLEARNLGCCLLFIH